MIIIIDRLVVMEKNKKLTKLAAVFTTGLIIGSTTLTGCQDPYKDYYYMQQMQKDETQENSTSESTEKSL